MLLTCIIDVLFPQRFVVKNHVSHHDCDTHLISIFATLGTLQAGVTNHYDADGSRCVEKRPRLLNYVCEVDLEIAMICTCGAVTPSGIGWLLLPHLCKLILPLDKIPLCCCYASSSLSTSIITGTQVNVCHLVVPTLLITQVHLAVR